MTLAHIAGIPVEETFLMCGPGLLAALAAAVAGLRSGWPTQRKRGDD